MLITPPPVNTFQLNPILKKERNNESTKAYAEAVKTVGEETQVTVLDIWSAFWKWSGEKEEGLAPLLTDGLHLTGEGYKVSLSEFFQNDSSQRRTGDSDCQMNLRFFRSCSTC